MGRLQRFYKLAKILVNANCERGEDGLPVDFDYFCREILTHKNSHNRGEFMGFQFLKDVATGKYDEEEMKQDPYYEDWFNGWTVSDLEKLYKRIESEEQLEYENNLRMEELLYGNQY